MRTRVLFVVPTLGLGGVERALMAVLDRLDRSRFEAALCVLGDTAGPVRPPEDVLLVELGRRSRWSFPRLVLGLRALLKNDRFDCVVAFSGTANLAVLAAGLTVGAAPPVVVTEHIAPLRMYGSSEEPFGWLKKLLIRVLYRRAAAILAVSHGVAAELRRLGVPAELVDVVHTPVDLDAIHRAVSRLPPQPQPPERPVTVVSVGRLTPQKNHRLLLEAASMLAPRLAVRIVIVGDGPLRDELEHAAAELELDVVFTGADPNPYRWMQQADAFSLSSSFEGFGVVIVEALALGIPVVSTDCPSGPFEILAGGKYGVLVPPEDATALAEALELVLTDPERAAELRRRGPERAAAFSSENATRAIEEVVEAVLRDRV